MSVHWLRNLLVITLALLMLDWILGVLCASNLIPLWLFMIPNFPFGALYVTLESSWAGTRYELWGLHLGEIESLLVFAATVLLQSLLYFALAEFIQRRRPIWPRAEHQR